MSLQGGSGGGGARTSHGASAGASTSFLSTPASVGGGDRVVPGWRERCGLGENLAIRSGIEQNVVKTPLSSSSSSDETEADVP